MAAAAKVLREVRTAAAVTVVAADEAEAATTPCFVPEVIVTLLLRKASQDMNLVGE